MRSDIKETTRQKKTNKNVKNKFSKTEYRNLKAHSNNVKMQSHKTLTTQIYFLLTIQQMESFLNGKQQQRQAKANNSVENLLYL